MSTIIFIARNTINLVCHLSLLLLLLWVVVVVVVFLLSFFYFYFIYFFIFFFFFFFFFFFAFPKKCDLDRRPTCISLKEVFVFYLYTYSIQRCVLHNMIPRVAYCIPSTQD